MSSTQAEALLRFEQTLAAAAALRAADELGVLDLLERGPVDPATLAAEHGLDAYGAERLLAALGAVGLLEVAPNGQFRSRVPGASVLRDLVAMWDGLPSALRGRRLKASVDTAPGAEGLYPRLTPFLASIFAVAAGRAADLLAAPGLRILDVGAGAAPWSLAIARRHPTTRVTAIDLPAVLPTTRAAVEDAGLAAVFELVAGDVFAVEWGLGRFDLVLAGNLFHLFDEPSSRRLLRRLGPAVAPEGTLAIIDILTDERGTGTEAVDLYALGLFVRSGSGRVHSFSAYARWLADEGFGRIERRELTSAPPLTLIIARRSG